MTISKTFNYRNQVRTDRKQNFVNVEIHADPNFTTW